MSSTCVCGAPIGSLRCATNAHLRGPRLARATPAADDHLLKLLAGELRPSVTLSYYNPADQGSDYLEVLDEAAALLKLLRAGRLQCSNCRHGDLSQIQHLANLQDGDPESGRCGCLWVECMHEVEGDEPHCLSCQPWTEDGQRNRPGR